MHQRRSAHREISRVRYRFTSILVGSDYVTYINDWDQQLYQGMPNKGIFPEGSIFEDALKMHVNQGYMVLRQIHEIFHPNLIRIPVHMHHHPHIESIDIRELCSSCLIWSPDEGLCNRCCPIIRRTQHPRDFHHGSRSVKWRLRSHQGRTWVHCFRK